MLQPHPQSVRGGEDRVCLAVVDRTGMCSNTGITGMAAGGLTNRMAESDRRGNTSEKYPK